MWLLLLKVHFFFIYFNIILMNLFVVYIAIWFPLHCVSDPTYVVAPVLQSRSGREDLKKLFAGFFSIFLN